jgi:hypothetical protein
MTHRSEKKIAIVGGGPGALLLYQHFVHCGDPYLSIDIYEKKNILGAGMPYSEEGANEEHLANVSANELPDLPISFTEWLRSVPVTILHKFDIKLENFHEYQVLPRLLLGQYLSAQFELALRKGKNKGIKTQVFTSTLIEDIIDHTGPAPLEVISDGGRKREYDIAIICTGHSWPKKHEGKVHGYYDSPYPPRKLKQQLNHPVAIRGSSLTAIDAICTLARENGRFETENSDKLRYISNQDAFKLVMHSIDGLLPAIRFHQEESHTDNDNNKLLPQDELDEHMKANNGFLSLDFIFDKGFKEPLRKKEPETLKIIQDLNLEAFVEWVMNERQEKDPFVLLKTEYAEAAKSIRQEKSIYWKELLSRLSFIINYPAKHFSAEDMLRLKKVLMSLISIIVAFIPQRSALELMALHDAGKLELIAVDKDSRVDPKEDGGIVYSYVNDKNETTRTSYRTFVDCIGQPRLSIEQFPFRSLVEGKTVSQAYLKYRDVNEARLEREKGEEEILQETDRDFYLKVPGLAINDKFQVLDAFNKANSRIYIMAVPHISGYNPDYSSLNFCHETSRRISESILES